MSNIKVKINNEWMEARNYQQFAFNKFIERENRVLSRLNIYSYNNHGIKFKIQRIIEGEEDYKSINAYGAIYLIKEDGSKIPIIDCNDITVFLTGNQVVPGSNWFPARNYQKLAFIDYLYDNQIRKIYKSKHTPGIGIELQIDNLQPNIKFSISKNSNHSIYYEKNNTSRVRIRICNSEYARRGYQAYYNRMTEPIIVIIRTPTLSTTSTLPTLPLHIIEEVTSIEEDQCCICYNIKQNIMFLPCKHIHTCSKCYKHINKNTCSICKQDIVKIEKI